MGVWGTQDTGGMGYTGHIWGYGVHRTHMGVWGTQDTGDTMRSFYFLHSLAPAHIPAATGKR